MQCRDVAVTITLVRLAPGRSRAAPSPEQEGVDVAARNREQKRVVVPPPTLPKNMIVVLTRAGELMDSSISEAYSFGARARKNQNGAAETQHNGEALCRVHLEDREMMPLYKPRRDLWLPELMPSKGTMKGLWLPSLMP